MCWVHFCWHCGLMAELQSTTSITSSSLLIILQFEVSLTTMMSHHTRRRWTSSQNGAVPSLPVVVEDLHRRILNTFYRGRRCTAASGRPEALCSTPPTLLIDSLPSCQLVVVTGASMQPPPGSKRASSLRQSEYSTYCSQHSPGLVKTLTQYDCSMTIIVYLNFIMRLWDTFTVIRLFFFPLQYCC